MQTFFHPLTLCTLYVMVQMRMSALGSILEDSAFGKNCLRWGIRGDWKSSLKWQVYTSTIWTMEVLQQQEGLCPGSVHLNLWFVILHSHLYRSKSWILDFEFKSYCGWCLSWPCDRTDVCCWRCTLHVSSMMPIWPLWNHRLRRDPGEAVICLTFILALVVAALSFSLFFFFLFIYFSWVIFN